MTGQLSDKRLKIGRTQVSGSEVKPPRSDRTETKDKGSQKDMEKFQDHYRVATENKNRRPEGSSLKSSTSLWTSGRNYRLYDESDFEKKKAVFYIEDIVDQELQLAKSSRK